MKERECPFVICFMCEFLGTIIMMYIGCMGCVDTFKLGPTIPAFTFGFSIIASIQIFSHFTPVHLNPALSVSCLILGKMHWKKVLVYIPAQYAGAMAGYALLKVTVMDHPGLCLLRLMKGTKPMQGFVLEALVAQILLLVVAGSTDEENHHLLDSISLRLGVLVAGLVFALEPYTGACLNPARSIPPCIFYMDWKDHWLYHLAPYVGMASGAVIYRMVLDNHKKYSLYSIFTRKS
ncbi:hypothetical protein NQ318_015346 [Aromia moschata]|uniref:Aquaporin n=1 Tax=Aromia moschata TaxID=1265417 RepID=A0AAV8YQS3_9CUCU|nr:hypothetical protein NQ318_015346 [Aromia moschata]